MVIRGDKEWRVSPMPSPGLGRNQGWRFRADTFENAEALYSTFDPKIKKKHRPQINLVWTSWWFLMEIQLAIHSWDLGCPGGFVINSGWNNWIWNFWSRKDKSNVWIRYESIGGRFPPNSLTWMAQILSQYVCTTTLHKYIQCHLVCRLYTLVLQ